VAGLATADVGSRDSARVGTEVTMVLRRRADDGTNYEDIKLRQPVYVAILFLSIFHSFLRIVDTLTLLDVNFFHRSLFLLLSNFGGPKCY